MRLFKARIAFSQRIVKQSAQLDDKEIPEVYGAGCFACHCEKRSDEAIAMTVKSNTAHRHCEARSDEAIQR
jgi:hypothetical protein